MPRCRPVPSLLSLGRVGGEHPALDLEPGGRRLPRAEQAALLLARQLIELRPIDPQIVVATGRRAPGAAHQRRHHERHRDQGHDGKREPQGHPAVSVAPTGCIERSGPARQAVSPRPEKDATGRTKVRALRARKQSYGSIARTWRRSQPRLELSGLRAAHPSSRAAPLRSARPRSATRRRADRPRRRRSAPAAAFSCRLASDRSR